VSKNGGERVDLPTSSINTHYEGAFMSKSYRQLTEEERIEIYALKKEGKSVSQIAMALERDRSTIQREINRNSGQRGYRPKQVHRKAKERQALKRRALKMTGPTLAYIREKLALQWSPDQISNVMGLDPEYTGQVVSHESIYLYIWEDKRAGGTLYKELRTAHKDRYRKRYGTHDYRGKIPNRKDIDERPVIVDQKERLGDWEADLVVGSAGSGYLVTLAERVSRMALIGFVDHKTVAEVTAEIIRLLLPHKQHVHTITFDNGREFNGHQEISRRLDCGCYFAKPYHSWERGLNENTNGLIRQYLPKKLPFPLITDAKLMHIMGRLNTRPRKSLDYVTPTEIYSQLIRIAS
jgi:IS30 family transposase